MRFEKDYAEELDKQDPLSKFKGNYMFFNGQLPLTPRGFGPLSKNLIKGQIDEVFFYQRAAHKAFEGWLAPEYQLVKNIAKLIGAKSNEVVLTHSLITGFHQLMATLYRPEGKRTKILM